MVLLGRFPRWSQSFLALAALTFPVVACQTESAPLPYRPGSSSGGSGIFIPLGGDSGSGGKGTGGKSSGGSASTGGSSSTGSNSGTGSTGSGSTGSGSAGNGEKVSISGDLREYVSDEFDQDTAFSGGTGTVYVTEGLNWVSQSGASLTFSFDSLTAADERWLAFDPDSTSGSYLTTFNQWDPQESTLTVGREGYVESIFQNFDSGVLPDFQLAQLVVRVEDASGIPIAEVSPSIPGSGAVFGYVTLGQWTDLATQTSIEGMFFAGNMSAANFPGSMVTVTLEGAVTANFAVPLARGALTVATFVVP